MSTALQSHRHDQDGVVSFSVTSDGTTGEEWIKRLESKGFCLGRYAAGVLLSKDFKPTDGITTTVAVLKGVLFEEDYRTTPIAALTGMLFKDRNRITQNIRAEGALRNLKTPNAEVACLIREKFTDKEIEAMGLWSIVVMHEPIKNYAFLLYAGSRSFGRWLDADREQSLDFWSRESGFAFAVSQVSYQS